MWTEVVSDVTRKMDLLTVVSAQREVAQEVVTSSQALSQHRVISTVTSLADLVSPPVNLTHNCALVDYRCVKLALHRVRS